MKNFPNILFILGLASLHMTGMADQGADAPTKIEPPMSPKPKADLPPIAHYWDSNSWEAGSGDSFWHKKHVIKSKSFPSTTPHPAPAKVTIPRKNTGQTETGKD